MVTQEQYPFGVSEGNDKTSGLNSIVTLFLMACIMGGLVIFIANVIRKNKANNG